MSQVPPGDGHARTLTYRSAAIGIACTVLLAVWVHVHEVLAPAPQALAENSPPIGAVALLLGVILAGGLVGWIGRRGRLARGELLVIYAMVVISAPLMSQGMWHRFIGLIVAVPHNPGNLDLVDAYSDKLWPHGPQLIADPRFVRGLGPGAVAQPAEQAAAVPVADSQVGPTSGIRLANPGDGGPSSSVSLRVRVDRHIDGKAVLIAGERYYCSALVRARGLGAGAQLTVDVVSDGGESQRVCTVDRETPPSFAHPGGFERRGWPYVVLPRDVGQSVAVVFALRGPGEVTITDVQFFSNEALARLHRGSREVAASDLARVPENQRDALLIRPDSLGSPAGLWYTLQGYIPYAQWATPLLYWLVIVMAVFLAMLGLGVILRRQWADHERFGFPMNAVPRMLLEEAPQAQPGPRPLFRNAAFLAGTTVALGYSVLLGLGHYVPGFPNPRVDIALQSLFQSSAARAAVNGFAGENRFTIVVVFVAIAFFVDLKLLGSVLVFLVLVHIPYYFGEALGWKLIRGPQDAFPFAHEQHIGAYLCLAGVVIWVSRRHLLAVGRRVLGLAGGADDRGEALSYRMAAILVLASFLTFAAWGAATGLGAGSALLFFGFLVICGLAAARIRTEFGAPAAYFTPYFPFLIFYLLGGLALFRTQTLLLAYVAGGFMAVAQFLLFAPAQVELLQLAREQQAAPRGALWALILGALGGVLLGGYVMLVWAYGVGGENIPYMRTWAINQDFYLQTLRASLTEVDKTSVAASLGTVGPSTQSHTAPLVAVGIGAGITALLAALRARIAGFWLHPIGYVLANTYFIYSAWGSLLVAWLAKAMVLRIGGPRLLRERANPFCVGLFVGAVAGVVVWDVVAMIALHQGVQDVVVILP